jgi:hypothetical protein
VYLPILSGRTGPRLLQFVNAMQSWN